PAWATRTSRAAAYSSSRRIRRAIVSPSTWSITTAGAPRLTPSGSATTTVGTGTPAATAAANSSACTAIACEVAALPARSRCSTSRRSGPPPAGTTTKDHVSLDAPPDSRVRPSTLTPTPSADPTTDANPSDSSLVDRRPVAPFDVLSSTPSPPEPDRALAHRFGSPSLPQLATTPTDRGRSGAGSVPLVADVADDRLEDVLERDQPDDALHPPVVAVGDHRHVPASPTHPRQHVAEAVIGPDPQRHPHHARGQQTVAAIGGDAQQVLGVQEADDVVAGGSDHEYP